MLVYFRLALRYRIIDKPNERSSHVKPTIRGGGIIFPVAVLFYSVLSSFSFTYLAIAVLLSGVVSFVDDIRDMPSLLRFSVHIVASILVLMQANVFSLPVILIVLAFILSVGLINAFNFMDGINGITGFYSLSILVPLMLTEDNTTNLELQSFVLVSILVFLLFNARKKAACFAGDVGSVTIAVIIAFLVIQRIVHTDDYKYLLFFGLYLTDTGLTIIQRWRMGEKIFQAHRRHLFQLLSNEMGMPHLVVALAYGALQFTLNLALINTEPGIPGIVAGFILLIATYILFKVRLLRLIRRAS